MTPQQQIAIKCKQAECDEKQAAVHMFQYVRKGWDAHPPSAFIGWWMPHGHIEPSGASIGGHLQAKRVWARKDPGAWERRTYGFEAEIAWNMAGYRAEFEAWVTAGSPAPEEEFVSIALPRDEQLAHLIKIEAMIGL